MASSSPSFNMAIAILFLFSLFLYRAHGGIICEELAHNVCAFSISSSGNRCLIETSVGKDGSIELQCRTSEVFVERIRDHIESNKCVEACGLDRRSVGISSDTLMESQFTNKLCSAECYQECPNIIDLYLNLAAGEGVFLPDLCNVQRRNPHRSMVELMSSGLALGPAGAAPGPDGAAPGPVGAAAPGPVGAAAPGPYTATPFPNGAAPGPNHAANSDLNAAFSDPHAAKSNQKRALSNPHAAKSNMNAPSSNPHAAKLEPNDASSKHTAAKSEFNAVPQTSNEVKV